MALMEEILDLYEMPYNPAFPVINFDERPCQLIDDIMVPEPMKQGSVRKEDYHYKRCGTCSVLLACEAKTGYRKLWTVKSNNKINFALLHRPENFLYPIKFYWQIRYLAKAQSSQRIFKKLCGLCGFARHK